MEGSRLGISSPTARRTVASPQVILRVALPDKAGEANMQDPLRSWSNLRVISVPAYVSNCHLTAQFPFSCNLLPSLISSFSDCFYSQMRRTVTPQKATTSPQKATASPHKTTTSPQKATTSARRTQRSPLSDRKLDRNRLASPATKQQPWAGANAVHLLHEKRILTRCICTSHPTNTCQCQMNTSDIYCLLSAACCLLSVSLEQSRRL